MKLQIECNELQAGLIKTALDIYSRVLMGQYKELTTLFEINSDYWMDDKKRTLVNTKIQEIKDIVLPELIGHEHFGIFNSECPEDSKIAWDLIQVIRYPLAWHRTPKGGIGVDFGVPIPASQQPLAIAKVVNDS